MANDAVHEATVREERDELHRAAALGIEEGVNPVDRADHLGPALGRDGPELLLEYPERERLIDHLLDLPPMGVDVETLVEDCYLVV